MKTEAGPTQTVELCHAASITSPFSGALTLHPQYEGWLAPSQANWDADGGRAGCPETAPPERSLALTLC